MNNTKLVHWPLMGGLLYLVQRGRAWAGCGPAQSPPWCTKCNSTPINGQCTNQCIAVWWSVTLWLWRLTGIKNPTAAERWLRPIGALVIDQRFLDVLQILRVTQTTVAAMSSYYSLCLSLFRTRNKCTRQKNRKITAIVIQRKTQRKTNSKPKKKPINYFTCCFHQRCYQTHGCLEDINNNNNNWFKIIQASQNKNLRQRS